MWTVCKSGSASFDDKAAAPQHLLAGIFLEVEMFGMCVPMTDDLADWCMEQHEKLAFLGQPIHPDIIAAAERQLKLRDAWRALQHKGI